MKQTLLFVFFLLLSLCGHAELNAELTDTEVSVGETFKLILTQDNGQHQGIPDLSALEKNFTIISTERSVSYSLINGQASSNTQWVILLSAKKEGTFTIPAFSIRQERSKPLSIEVSLSAAGRKFDGSNFRDHSKEVMLLTEVSTDNPYVNQEVIYTVKLLSSQRLLDADYQGPQVEDALMIPLGSSKHYETIENNRRYAVEEQRYAIFPQKSGTTRITSPLFKALIFDDNPRRINAQDKTIQLSVKPMPSDFKGKHWLPAKAVSLSESYDNPQASLRQGDSLIRKVTIESVAAPAQLLPRPEFKSTDQYKVYPEKPEEKNLFRQQQLVGTSTLQITYLFNKAGTISIPELRLPWFNTSTGKEEVAILPPKTFQIGLSESTAQQPSPTTPAIDKSSENPSPITQPLVASTQPVTKPISFAWILAGLFALAWLITMGLWYRQKNDRHTSRKDAQLILNQLKQACQNNDPQQASEFLLKWANDHWPQSTILNLADLAKRVRDPQFKKQINQLSHHLYSQDKAKTAWQGEQLWRCVLAYKKMKPIKKSKEAALPPINPF